MFKSVLRSDKISFNKISPIWPTNKAGDKTKSEQEQTKAKNRKELFDFFIKTYKEALEAKKKLDEKTKQLEQTVDKMSDEDKKDKRVIEFEQKFK